MNKLQLSNLVNECIAYQAKENIKVGDFCGHFQLDQDLGIQDAGKLGIMAELEVFLGIDFKAGTEKDWYIVDDVYDSVVKAGGRL